MLTLHDATNFHQVDSVRVGLAMLENLSKATTATAVRGKLKIQNLPVSFEEWH
jgi:hypothetical protein